MGCGSSSPTKNTNPQNTNPQNDNYYHPDYDYGYNSQYVNPNEQYRESWQEDNMYYGDNVKNVVDHQKHAIDTPLSHATSSPYDDHQKHAIDTPLSHATSSPYDEKEDETPFDDDGFIDNEKYYQSDMGLFIKFVDFRTRFVDEKQEKRPRISSGNLYIDSEFPLKIAIKDSHDVEWKRPKEFIAHPRLFTDGPSHFDIGQGAVGTCWFLAVLAHIADNNKIMKQVIPESSYTIEDPERYDGVFHARLFKFGKWEDVYIDDYLPVVYGKQLWGAKSASDFSELWVALLEKAFARMHGSYDAIYGDQPGDAYMLLTGGIGEHVDLQNKKPEEQAKVLYDRIKNALSSGCHVSCIVPDEHDNYKGLVGGHAYSVVDVYEHKASGTKLIKLYNPWGNGEWKGAWSDGSSEWSTIPQNSVIAPIKDDGKFYVSLSDFMKYFSQTTICSLTPNFDCDGRTYSLNYVLNIYGEWNGKTAAGFHNLVQNQRFGFTVTENGLVGNNYMPLVVQIVQQSKARKSNNVSIRCDIFKVLADKIQPKSRQIALELLGTKNNVYTSELQTSFRHKLKPGRYIIVASTADKGQEKAFLLRLFTPAPLENVKEIPIKADLVSCDDENTINVKGRTYALTFEKALFGQFITGHNAGGQMSHNTTYHLNPQYLITIPESGNEIPLVVNVMQTQVEPQYPIGIRIFKLDKVTRPPVDVKYLYQHFNESPATMDGSQYKFKIAWSLNVKYLLQPGRYIALVYLDQQNTEKIFSIVFKSTVHVGIKGFQTG